MAKVYEVEFDIEGTYQDIIHEVLSWCEERIERHVGTPIKLNKDSTFEHEIGIDLTTRTIDNQSWVLEYKVPQQSDPRFDWKSCISLLELHNKVTFNLSLETTNVYAFPSRPRIIPNLISKFNCSKNGWNLHRIPIIVSENNELLFLKQLKSDDRPLPFVAVSQLADGSTYFDMDKLADVLCVISNVFLLDRETTFAISDTLGREWSVFNGAARVYMPRLGNDMYKHPLYTPNYISEKGHEKVARKIFRDLIDNSLNRQKKNSIGLESAPLLLSKAV